MATQVAGTDHKFVTESQELLFDCPVCLQVLCKPYMSQCCNNNFCRACITKIQNSGNPCPLCRKANFVTQRNNALCRQVYLLQVYCTNKSKGCEWVGNYGEIEVHLNQRPDKRHRLNGCRFVHIQCMYCSASFPRYDINDHHSQCPSRPFSCEFCQSYDSYYDDVFTNHWPMCRYYPVLCPNNCNSYIPRQRMKDHIATDCSMTIVECDFKQFGCKEKLSRKEMKTHLKNSVAAHEMLEMMTKLIIQLKKQSRDLRQLETKLHEKHKKLTKEQKDLFEKRMSSTMNEIVETAQQQNKTIKELEESFHERNKKMLKKQSKTFNSWITSTTDNIKKSVWQQVEDQFALKYSEQINELREELNQQRHELQILRMQRQYQHRSHSMTIARQGDYTDIYVCLFFVLVVAAVYWLGGLLTFQIVFLFLVSCPCGWIAILRR